MFTPGVRVKASYKVGILIAHVYSACRAIPVSQTKKHAMASRMKNTGTHWKQRCNAFQCIPQVL